VPLYESGDCADYAACIPVCDEAKSSDCPTHDLKPILDEAKVSEEDTVFGGVEQVWVRYYSTRSVIVREPRLVADSTLGVLDSYGTTFRAPKTPGPFHLWAVVQDERGGVGWARATVLAR